MDVERLKHGVNLTDDFFESQLEKIREIRLSEHKLYQKITDIYATAMDYDVTAQATKRFFATVQNKLHWVSTGKRPIHYTYLKYLCHSVKRERQVILRRSRRIEFTIYRVLIRFQQHVLNNKKAD